MPNPKPHQPPIVDRFMLSEGWRVVVRHVHGERYIAQLERQKGQAWKATGPTARSDQSQPVVLSRLASGLRGLADLIDYGLALRPNLRVAEGCPACRYTHIRMYESDRGDKWFCSACNASGDIPKPSRRPPYDHATRSQK